MFTENNKKMNKRVKELLTRVLRGIAKTNERRLSDEAIVLLNKEDVRRTEVWNLAEQMIARGWRCEKLEWKKRIKKYNYKEYAR